MNQVQIPVQLQLRIENQLNVVAEEVAALISVVRPILTGLLYALKREAVADVGGHTAVRLRMLPRLYRPGDGDCGICFEYAVHDAIRRQDAMVLNKVVESMARYCRVPGHQTASILFGAEKTGAVQIIETADNVLTDESRLLTGAQAQPIKLKRYINQLAAAFRRPTTRASLPTSISGLWKADLFLGNRDSDRWVGTTVKINPNHLEAAKGLRVGIIPSQQGRDDRIRYDDTKNIVICPLPYDGAFMELFYMAWGIVQQFIAADAQMPSEVSLPMAAHRMVARHLVDRREFPLVEVIEALNPLSQPALLQTQEQITHAQIAREGRGLVNTVIAPISRLLDT